MRELLKRELARVLRAVAEHLDREPLSPEAADLLAKGLDDAKAGRASPVPPTFVPVPYPYPFPAPPLDVRPWPGYPEPYIGDPWPPWTIPTITWTSDSLIIPAAPNGETFPIVFSNN